MDKVLVYVVIINSDYDSLAVEVFRAKEDAMSRAKGIAEGWVEDGIKYEAGDCTDENTILYEFEGKGGRYVCMEGSPLQ